MRERQNTFQPIGLNARGQWVNYNNTCLKCKHPMPLPEMNNKYCPKCSTLCQVPDRLEPAEEKAKKVCYKCGYSNLRGSIFCINCGTKL